MKVLPILCAAGLAAAVPTQRVDEASVEARQYGYGGYPSGGYGGSTTNNDLQSGSASNCPKVIFICARGSTETGNMGSSVCPEVATGLKKYYPNQVWVQGVGGAYTADLQSNAQPGGSSTAAMQEAAKMFTMAQQKCPKAAVAAGGYSQGTAVIAGGIKSLSETIKDQIKGVVLFGYTQAQQTHDTIPNFPVEKTKIFCAQGDMVCNGTLTITQAHFSYATNGDASERGPAFLHEKIGSV